MQAKKQNVLLAGLHFLLGVGFLVLTVISVIELIDLFDYMNELGIFLNIAAVVGTVFVFCIPSFTLGMYFMDMDKPNQMYNTLRWSVAGWVILLIETLVAFIYTLVEYKFVFENLLGVILTLLPLIFIGVVYKKREAMGNDLNACRVGAVLYFMYLGLFNTIYKAAVTGIGSGAENIITFILSAVMGLTISLSICYYYFKLGNTAQPQQYGPQNNYGYGPQQPYGQQYGQQNGPLQQFRQQQNGYAAPAAPVPPVQQAPAAKFCTSCGSQVDPNAAFCNNCGNKLQ
jgi:hypothetical protein